MLRRHLISALLGVPLAGCMAHRPVPSHGPHLWVASRNKARVFLFGFGDAKDQSWLTPRIAQAFDESSELWVETRSPDGSDNQDAEARGAAAEQMERLGRVSGSTLFDALEPRVAERTLVYLKELGIKREAVEPLRPWRAYYAIVGAFWAQRNMSYKPINVDAVLGGMARSDGERIGYEMPTSIAFFQFMAAMTDKAQSQYIEWLLDYIDDFKNGINTDETALSWIDGNHDNALRSLHRMRTNMPDLYQLMQVERNGWWARKINELLATTGSYFVAVGQLHVLGPDGIPQQLERMGIKAKARS